MSLHGGLTGLTLLLLQMAVIIALAKVLGLVARRMGQPAVIAEIVAGIMLGPSLLGRFAPTLMAELFPTDSLGTLRLFSQFGLIVFMFLVGLEFDPRLLRGKAHSSVAISASSIALPFLLGGGLGAALHRTTAPAGVGVVPFALFIGVSMSVTAFPVLARILSERNLMSSRVGSIAIACAAVDDVTAWCVLAFVVAAARAHSAAEAVLTTGLTVGFIVGMVWVVRPLATRVTARLREPTDVTTGVMSLVFIVMLLAAAATEAIGVHALFGAFLFGAVLPKEGALATRLAERIETVAAQLLLPLFFAFSGLRTEITLLDSAGAWATTALVIVVATVGKFGGSTLVARLTGLRWREASAVGVLMNTRGLMELVVLNIGLDLGVISPVVFAMLVVMALVTTLATSPVLRAIYPDAELRKDLPDLGSSSPNRV